MPMCSSDALGMLPFRIQTMLPRSSRRIRPQHQHQIVPCIARQAIEPQVVQSDGTRRKLMSCSSYESCAGTPPSSLCDASLCCNESTMASDQLQTMVQTIHEWWHWKHRTLHFSKCLVKIFFVYPIERLLILFHVERFQAYVMVLHKFHMVFRVVFVSVKAAKTRYCQRHYNRILVTYTIVLIPSFSRNPKFFLLGKPER